MIELHGYKLQIQIMGARILLSAYRASLSQNGHGATGILTTRPRWRTQIAMLCRQSHPAQHRFAKYLSFYYKVTWIRISKREAYRGGGTLTGNGGIYSFMYIIIYIINYNEYIVMYNIESHSLTITSTT